MMKWLLSFTFLSVITIGACNPLLESGRTCKDVYKSCFEEGQNSKCFENAWMRKNCAKYCGFCGKLQAPNVSNCVVLQHFGRIECRPTPTLKELRRMSGLLEDDFKLNVSYAIYSISNKRIDRQGCCIKEGCRCRIYENGTVVYPLESNIIVWLYRTIKLEMIVSYKDGYIRKNFTVNVCEIGKPRSTFFNVAKQSSTALNFEVEYPSISYILPFVHHITCEAVILRFNRTVTVAKETEEKSRKIVTMDGLKPGLKYKCAMKAKYITKEGNRTCDSLWSDPVTINVWTLPTAPSRGPEMYMGMVRKSGKRCHIYFLPINKHDRNGNVTNYRLYLVSKTLESSYFDFMASCDELQKNISISGYTVGGWGNYSTVPLNLSSASRTDAEVELWRIGDSGTYRVKRKLNASVLKTIRKFYILICNCGDKCERENSRCTTMRKMEWRNGITVKLDLLKERVSFLILSSDGNSMSDWIQCSYNNQTIHPYRGHFQLYRVTNHEIVLNKDDYSCSRELNWPVNYVYTKVTCGQSEPKKWKTTRQVGKPFKIAFDKNSDYSHCKVELSYDDVKYDLVSDAQGLNGGSTSMAQLALIVIPIAIALLLLLVFRKRLKKYADECRRGQENPKNPTAMKFSDDRTPYDRSYHTAAYESIQTADRAADVTPEAAQVLFTNSGNGSTSSNDSNSRQGYIT